MRAHFEADDWISPEEAEIYTRNGKKWEYRLFSEGDDIEITCLNMTIPIEKLYINAILPSQNAN